VDAVIGTDPGRGVENVGDRRSVHEFQHPPSRHPRYTCTCTPLACDSRGTAEVPEVIRILTSQGITVVVLSSCLGNARLVDQISTLAKQTSSANTPYSSFPRSRRGARLNRQSNRRREERRACRIRLYISKRKVIFQGKIFSKIL